MLAFDCIPVVICLKLWLISISNQLNGQKEVFLSGHFAFVTLFFDKSVKLCTLCLEWSAEEVVESCHQRLYHFEMRSKSPLNVMQISLISFFSSTEPKYLSRKVSIRLTVILGNNRMLFALYSQKFYEKSFAKKNLFFIGIAPETISELRMHFSVMQKKFYGMHLRLRYSLRRYTDKNFYEKNFTKKIYFSSV